MEAPRSLRTRVTEAGNLCRMLLPVVILASAAWPHPVHAQTPRLAVAARAGTAGLGGEVALGLTPRLSLRGGVGWLPFEYEATYDDQRYSVDPPGRYLTLQADLALVGPLRFTGGLLHRSGPVVFDADLQGQVEVGDQTYTSEGRLDGEVHSAATSPFLGLGIGHTVGSGMGIYLDVAVAFTGDPDLELVASGPITQEPGFQAELEREQARAEADLNDYYRYWPVVSLGVRWGLGG